MSEDKSTLDEPSPAEEGLLLLDRALQMSIRALHKQRVVDKSLRMPSIDDPEKREADAEQKRQEIAADVVEAAVVGMIAEVAGADEEEEADGDDDDDDA